ILLQFAGGKGCGRIAPPFFLFYVLYRPTGFFESRDYGIHLLLVGQRRSIDGFDNRLFSVDSSEARSKLCLCVCRSELSVEGPILDWNEGFDLALAFHDQAQSHGLYTARGEAAPYFIPQQRRNL